MRSITNRERLLLLLTIIAIVSLVAGYVVTSVTVTVILDGTTTTIRTHRTNVAGLLAEMGVKTQENDAVSPSPSSSLRPGLAIRIERARRVSIAVDGVVRAVETHAQTPAAILYEYGISLDERDRVLIDNQLADLRVQLGQRSTTNVSNRSQAAFSLAGMVTASQTSVQADLALRPAALAIAVQRAVPLSILQDGVETSTKTAARTVGEALFGEGIYVYAADIVTPALDRPVAAGTRISIQRAKLVTVTADGRTFATRTQANTIAGMLVQEGIALQDKDYTTPDVTTAVSSSMVVQLTRVREETVTESEAIPFSTVRQPDGNMELDQSSVATPGKPGTRKRTTRMVFENGKEVRRFVEREWVDEEPTTQTIAYGTRVVIRTATTPDGPIEYWRALRVWATYYSPATSGKAHDHPQYGITRTGIRATKGVIAVDPAVIRLHSRMYVPGYGFGAAEDTGGLILGMHIDLAYDDNEPGPMHVGWVTIYLLTPTPGDIPWVLPDYPVERR